MKHNLPVFSVLLLTVILAGSVVMAAVKTAQRFEPVFRLIQARGSVMVHKPGEAPTKDQHGNEVFPVAQDKKAYPFGTRVITGPDGSVDVYFTKHSRCEIGACASLIIGEDSKDKKTKIIRLEQGKVNIFLEKGIEENGNSLNVEAGQVIVQATNLSQFAVEAALVDEISQAIVSCNDQIIKVFHPALFEALLECSEKGREKALSVGGSRDGSYARVVGIKGVFGMKVKNPKDPDKAEEEELKTVEELNAEAKMAEELHLPSVEEGYKYIRMEPGTSVKFNHKRHGPTDAREVVLLVISPIGAKLEEITYNEVKEGAAPVELPASDVEVAPAPDAEVEPAPDVETKPAEKPRLDLPAIDLSTE
ncbi:MAG: hypothetical protein QME60_08150 [Verrucomicrobiota bacterium]|nr:hypothetical protein [Verrucomicrobiota bacterium]